MSALNAILTKDSVILAMDTQVTEQGTGRPIKTVTKFLPLPHMNCIVCGTGSLELILKWFSFIENRIISNGIYQLDKITNNYLNDIIGDVDYGCTIYQFGLHEIDKTFHGYVYRKDNNYISESLEYGLICKPKDAFIEENGVLNLNKFFDVPNQSYDELLFKIMLEQKEYDDSLPYDKQVGIGGIMQIVYLTSEQYIIKNYKYFDDYEEKYKIMTNNKFIN